MKCRSCGAENHEGMKFCTSCGSELEQKRVCPSCGSEAEEGAAFCGRCGAKIMAPRPKEPVQKAEVMTEKIAAPGSPATDEAFEDYEEPKPFAFPFKKIFGLAANVLVIALATALLIFTFFIGVSSTTAFGASIVSKSSASMLDYLRIIPELIGKISFTGIASVATFIVTIVLVAVFSILALVVAIQKLLGKKKTNGGKWVASAFIAYAVGATLIKSYFDLPQNTSSGATAMLGFNGATVAGITICSILVAAFLACQLISRGKELLDIKVIVNGAFAIAGIVLAGVVIAMIASTAYTISFESETINQGYLQMAMTIAHEGMTESIFEGVIENGWIASIILLLPALLCVAVAAFAGVVMRHCCGTFFKKSHKPSFVWSIVLVVVSLLLLIVSAVVGNLFAGGLTLRSGNLYSYSIVPVGAIAVFVLSLILLGVSIARVCVNNYLSNRPSASAGAKETAPKEESAPKTEEEESF